MIQITKKTKNSILAIPAAAVAIIPKPKSPAIIAIIRNSNAHLSIRPHPLIG